MNIKKLVGAGLVAGAVAISSISGAAAAVTFDPETGKGFVGKGDVQIALGWNNKELQTNAEGVSFSYESLDTYEATCTFTTGEGTRGERIHNVDHKKKTSVDAAVSYDARVKNQITGFILTGWGITTTSGSVPVEGEACPGNGGHGGVWSDVDLLSSSGGQLFVNHNRSSVLLPY